MGWDESPHDDVTDVSRSECSRACILNLLNPSPADQIKQGLLMFLVLIGDVLELTRSNTSIKTRHLPSAPFYLKELFYFWRQNKEASRCFFWLRAALSWQR